jgi:hypothetical protein
MQVSTLTKDNIPGPNRELMQQAFTRLMVPSHGAPKKNNWVLGRVPRGFAKLLHTPVLGCQLHNENTSRQHTNGLFRLKCDESTT